MRYIFASFIMLLSTLPLNAQARFNPVTQINWPQITGAGAPSVTGAACAAANYGQPYQDTSVTPNTRYHCSANGWELEASGGTITSGVTATSMTTLLAGDGDYVQPATSSQVVAALGYTPMHETQNLVTGPGGGAVTVGHVPIFNNTDGTQLVDNALNYVTGGGGSSLALGYVVGIGASGTYNLALGFHVYNTTATGGNNAAIGYGGLQLNTSGSYNTAVGVGPLAYNTTGSQNTGVGLALNRSTTGTGNTSVGYASLDLNTTGNYNTAVGWTAMHDNTGSYNTALGGQTGSEGTGSYNTAIGWSALNAVTTGGNNIGLGANAAVASGADSNEVVIGAGSTGMAATP